MLVNNASKHSLRVDCAMLNYVHSLLANPCAAFNLGHPSHSSLPVCWMVLFLLSGLVPLCGVGIMQQDCTLALPPLRIIATCSADYLKVSSQLHV